MASSRGIRLVIEIVLAIVIVALSYWLYLTITGPAEMLEREARLTEETRERMDFIRQALIRYERQNDRFLTTLDSIETYAAQDSFLRERRIEILGEDFPLDSAFQSPRTGEPFRLTVNDTSDVAIYLLEDPYAPEENFIGQLEPDPTEVNAASWE